MPFVPSTSSDHTPPSQVPQYSKRLACACSPRCSTATPELSQSRTVYPASRTTLIELVELLLSCEDELFERSAKILQLARREDAWRLAVVRIDAVLVRRSLPGAGYLLFPRRRRRSLGNRIDVVSVPCRHVVRACKVLRIFHPPQSAHDGHAPSDRRHPVCEPWLKRQARWPAGAAAPRTIAEPSMSAQSKRYQRTFEG